MKVFEYMSFDPSWFKTTPGLLITGGVVLLLIALIVLLAAGKKNKNEGEVVSEQPASLDSSNVSTDVPVQPAVSEEQQVNIAVPAVEQPVANPQEEAPKVEIFEPSTNNVVEPIVPETPANDVPVDQAATPGVLNIEASQNNVSQEPAVEISQPAPVEEKKEVSIYGGVSPTVPAANIYSEQPSKPVIYGGADPLENTAPIPKVEKPVETPSASPLFEARPVEAAPVEIPAANPTSVVEKGEEPIPDVSSTQAPVPPASVETPSVQPTPSEPEMETLDF